MRRIFIITVLAAAVVLVGSCRKPVGGSKMTIQYVRDILSNPSSPEAAVLSALGGVRRDAAIYVVGDSVSARFCGKSLAACDEFDNVSGNLQNDKLPDFAGETISVISDEADAPYFDIINEGRYAEMRSITVRQAIQTVDTLCHLSVYDVDGLGRKLPAKIIVFSSPYATPFGLFDVDSLFSASGCSISVVSPMSTLFDSAFGAGCFTLAVISDRESLENRLHETYFYDEISARNIVGANCFCFAPSGYEGEDVLTAMMDAYVAKGGSEPIDGILIDNSAVNAEKIKATLNRITDVMNEESVLYSPVISPKVNIFDSRETLRHRCHGILRESNLFTHYISAPKLKDFRRLFNPAGVGTVIVEK